MLQLKRSCKVLEKQYFNRPLFYSGSEKVVFEDAPTIKYCFLLLSVKLLGLLGTQNLHENTMS